MLGLRRKKVTRNEMPSPRPDPQALVDAQSVSASLISAVAAVLVLSGFWMLITLLFDRVFPWFTIVQGLFVGLAVRRYGRGLDWRFPVIAGGITLAGAFFGNLLIAIPTTAGELGISAFAVVRGLTWWSIEVFFDEVISVVDYIYAFFAVAVAVFYSKRRLNRNEEFVLRTRHARTR